MFPLIVKKNNIHSPYTILTSSDTKQKEVLKVTILFALKKFKKNDRVFIFILFISHKECDGCNKLEEEADKLRKKFNLLINKNLEDYKDVCKLFFCNVKFKLSIVTLLSSVPKFFLKFDSMSYEVR